MQALKSKQFCNKFAGTRNKKLWFGSSGWTLESAMQRMTDALKIVWYGQTTLVTRTICLVPFTSVAASLVKAFWVFTKSNVETTQLLNV